MGSMMKPFGGKGEPPHWDLYRKTWANPKVWVGEVLNPGRTQSAQPVAQQAQPYQRSKAIGPTNENTTGTTQSRRYRLRRKATRSNGTILVDEDNY